MKYLSTAIYARCAVGTPLHTAIGGRIYKHRAPDAPTYPYVVYGLVSDVADPTFTEGLEDVLIQFSLFSSDSSSGEIEDMFTYLRTLYDDCIMPMTGAVHLSMRRQDTTLVMEDHPTPTGTMQIWHYAVDYAIMFQRN